MPWPINSAIYLITKKYLIFILIELPNTFFYSFTQQFWELYWTLIGLLINLSVQTFQPLIVIYRRGNFVYHHGWCTSIYWTLSYPFRSLVWSYPLTFSPCIYFLTKYWIWFINGCIDFLISSSVKPR